VTEVEIGNCTEQTGIWHDRCGCRTTRATHVGDSHHTTCHRWCELATVSHAPGLRRATSSSWSADVDCRNLPASRVGRGDPFRAANVLGVVLGAGFIGLAAQLSLPVPGSPVPVTGQTFAVLLVGAAGGLRRGVASTLLYALAGLFGVPWFAGGASGYVTATFGYIVEFVLAAAVVGALAERGWTRSPWRTFTSMLIGSAVIYAIGVPWLARVLGVSLSDAVRVGLTPFLMGDILKAALAAGLFTVIWARMDRARRSD